MPSTVKRTVARALSALLLLLAPILVYEAPSSTAALRRHVVKIESGPGHGSGVVIENGLVLTAAHVVWRDNLVINGKPAYVVKLDRSRDLALVAADVTCGFLQCPKIAGWSPKIDQSVTAVGFPLTMPKTVTTGTVQSFGDLGPNAFEAGARFMQFSAPIIFGNSGGPVFDRAGHIVGIATNVAAAEGMMFGIPIPHLGIAASLESIREFLAE